MAARAEPLRRTHSGGCLLAIIAIGIVLLLMAQMMFSAEHALERHGEDAVTAAKAIAGGGFSRWKCDDGRDHLVKRLPGKADRWAVIVVDQGQFIGGLSWQAILDLCVTAFISDHDYVTGVNEPCRKDLNGGHP